MTRRLVVIQLACALVAVLANASVASAQRRGGPPPGTPPPTPRATAPFDATGYWVSVVTEDWRYRMVTPAKGDYQGVPMNADAARLADVWDPAADEAAGVQCRSYGAPAIMRVPGRLHVTWQDDTTMKVEADAGTQTRLLRFAPSASKSAERTWQGDSAASWELPARGPVPPPGGRGAQAQTGEPRPGSLKVITTNLRAGYLRKNGVPYSENAVLTEYFDVARMRNGDELLVVTAVVEDPRFLTQPFIVSTQFKRLPDAAGWDPTPCSATW
jgi:hypothetical protein